MAELVYAWDLKSHAERIAGSSPARATFTKTKCRSGEIGRHAALRTLFPKGSAGSSPVFGTKIEVAMEVSVGDYGRMMFEMMLTKGNLPDHWQSIKEEAEPLVRKLLDLNARMSNGGYEVHGYLAKGKKVLSSQEKIKTAQSRFVIPASELQEGDRFWLFDNYHHEMYIGQDEPLLVDEVTKKGVFYYTTGRIVTARRIDANEKVIKAPDCFKEDDELKQQEFQSDEYWLKLYEASEL